jgi:hypothetical protein
MRTMEWNEKTWIALKNAVTPMPSFVRKRALRKIIDTSEESAKTRGSSLVEARDLIRAVKERVPGSVRKYCYEALTEQGIAVSEKDLGD